MLINKLAKLKRSSRNVTSVSLVAIAALAMYNRIVAPRANYLFAAQRYESVVGQMAKKNEAISNAVEVKKKKLQMLREQSALLNSTLFTDAKAREFFSDLQVISHQTGCTVNSFNFIPKEPGSKAHQFEETAGAVAKTVVLSVVGGYQNIIRLLERLQRRTEKVWIDSVNMRTLDYRSPLPRCDMTITIYTIQERRSRYE